MTSITNFAEAEAALNSHVPQQLKNTGKHFSLDRIEPLMQALDNPHKKLKIIHVAGTSGKTSTTYYITALLVAAGKKVGTTVSPHIDSVTERVQIDGLPITETEFYTNLNQFMQLIDGIDMTPTYFELIIAFAYWYFVKQQVDYAVVETGIGGLLDATNIAENPDKICVITDIGYDHMNILGNSLQEIAAQKAGIIHPKNIAIMHRQTPEIMEVFEAHCRKVGAELLLAGDQEDSRLDELPPFQQRNWLLAQSAFKVVQKRDNLPEITDEKLQITMHIQVPGRMDERTFGGKTLIMDGAHNGQKMEAFVQGFKHKFPGKKAAVLLSLKAGKEYAEALPGLATITDELIITSFSLMQDTPHHSMDLEELTAQARTLIQDVKLINDQAEAYQTLLASKADILVVTGSFYLIAQLRNDHKELQQNA
jgi:dihydrofolate synthase/folylpolyglutamate synthase